MSASRRPTLVRLRTIPAVVALGASARNRVSLLILLAGASPAVARGQEPVTLQQAVAEALSNHPDLQAAQAEIDARVGLLRAAGTFPLNPEVGFLTGPSRAPDTTYVDFEVGLAQALELGGKRSARQEGADARLQGALARLSFTEAAVAARVKGAYARARLGRDALETTLEAEALTVELRDAAVRRLERGAGTQLELNVASAAEARARRDRLVAERRLRSAMLELAVAMGRRAGTEVVPAGPPPPPATIPTLDALLLHAYASRGDLVAAGAELRATGGDLRLADALRWPDPSLAASFGKEENLEKASFGMSFALPLWNRNQGQRDAARAERARMEALELSLRREVELQVLDAYQAFESAREAEEAFGRDAVASLADNLDLARRSYEAGKLDLAELSVYRRDLVETQLAYLDARADLLELYYALELAAGGSLTPEPEAEP